MAFKFIARLFGAAGAEPLAAGRPAPLFTLKDLEGQEHALEDALKRGPVLLAFFKVSCPTCQFTFPYLERLHQSIRRGDNPPLWGISQDDAPNTRQFAQEYGCTFPMLVEEDGYPVSNDYGLTNVPTLFLIQPSREIQLASVGFDRRDLEAIAEALGRLSGQPVALFRPGEPVPDHKPG
ncbi:MAG: redoxin domain-containing protein [Candidatus Acidoferrales bacterium]